MKLLPQSIRWRIQAWHGLLLLAVLGGFGVTAYRLESGNSIRRLDRELQIRVSALTGVLAMGGPRDGGGGPGGERRGPPPDINPDGRPPGGEAPEGAQGEHPREGSPGERPPEHEPGRPPSPGTFRLPPELQSFFSAEGGFYYIVWTRRGEMLDHSANAPSGAVPPAQRSGDGARSRAGMREAYLITPPGECILAGAPEGPRLAEMTRFALWLALVCGGVLAFGLAGGWWVAARAIAPIDAISTAATRIAAGRLDERIDAAETESELGQLAVLLNDTFERLSQAFAEQARFSSDAAHELRTPISIISGQVQLALARPRTGDEYREALAMVQRAAKRMQNLIESLLALASLEAGAGALRRTPCDLAELAMEHLELIRPLAAERGVVLRAELVPAPCAGDPGRIGQILANLLANAVKYTQPGDVVCVSTHRQNGSALASVADAGPGIAGEHLPHIFERFYRIDASRNRGTGGAGLGLAICKSLAEAHGGCIEVASEPGRGSTFTLRLPAE